jgi:transglutaminase-like putative cysteine protease
MRLSIQHITSYQYNQAFGYALAQVCLSPQSGASQTVESWTIQAPGRLFPLHDEFGNLKHQYSFIGSSQTSCVQVSGKVTTHGIHSWQEDGNGSLPFLFLRGGPLTQADSKISAFARNAMGLAEGERAPNSIETLLTLSQAVSQRVVYKKNHTTVETSALDAFEGQAGVCQDQAHVMLVVCRSLGFPTRYVSGYFFAENEPDLASHAWVEVCVDVQSRTWVGIDVTHSCLVDERHIRVATGIDYSSCPPVKGIRHGGHSEEMQVEISIVPT